MSSQAIRTEQLPAVKVPVISGALDGQILLIYGVVRGLGQSTPHGLILEVVGALLGALGIASSLILWMLGDTAVDRASQHAYFRCHEMHEVACRDVSHESIHAASFTPA